MVYRYDYKKLFSASPSAGNFKPLNQAVQTQDFSNTAVALLNQQGLSADTMELDAAGKPTTTSILEKYIDKAATDSGGSTVKALQNIAGLTRSDTAVDRKDTWGGSDDTMGRSFLEKLAAPDSAGLTGTAEEQVKQLYDKGFGRAGDDVGIKHWADELSAGTKTIGEIADFFSKSEEANLRDVYSDNYSRDIDEEGIAYWMGHTGTEEYTKEWNERVANAPEDVDWTRSKNWGDHQKLDYTSDVDRIIKDSATKETSVRRMLSEQLGIHSNQAQLDDDASLGGAFTDASEADVFRMMKADDLGAKEIADKVKMQTAARSMGDYGGGVDDAGATGIHRILANQEMGGVVNEATGDRWVSNQDTLAKTGDDYLPQVTKDADGNVTESNVWGLLKAGTQDYGGGDVPGMPDPSDPTDPTDPKLPPDYKDPDPIVVTNEDFDSTPELHSDVKDTSTYGKSKAAFDSDAAGIDAPLQDMMIRNTGAMSVGGSAEGVRLKRSKKFKAGDSALGTKQLGRQLQLKSLNI